MSSAPPESLTYAACLTPPGTGAIATLAVRGPRAWEVVRELFRPASQTSEVAKSWEVGPDSLQGRIWLGKFGDDTADEVVLLVKQAAPVPWVELHCHGGRQVVRMLLALLERRGVRICSWQQLEQATAGNPVRAAAAAALAQAPTVRTAAILLDQYQGAFERAVQPIQAALARDDGGEAQRLLQELTRYGALGRHLTVPWRVVVAGAPNVGKSSLVNALAGYPRSIVADTPGTTRDVVTTAIAVDGWPVELIDTAGLRDHSGSLEAAGIERGRTAAAAADLCLWVLDAAAPPVWPSVVGERVRCIVNKMDLPAVWDLSQAPNTVSVSARSGAGVPELCQTLAHWLVPEPPPAGSPVPFTPALASCLEQAQQCLAAGQLAEARHILIARTRETA